VPRLIDRLDAAAGRTPEFLDLDVDYLTRRRSPARLIDDQGHYNAGWYEAFDGRINLGDSSAFDAALQRWFHVTLDTPDHFVVMNLADMGRASNTALMVVDKASGGISEASLTGLGPANQVEVCGEARAFRDPPTASFIRVEPDGDALAFSVHADHLHLSGLARVALGPPLVQVTRFHRGRGALQWYGNLSVVSATLTVGDRVIALPPGTLGTFDRTVGHQRGIQSWHWIAAAGHARDCGSGERVALGLQVARDQPAARPRVESKKYAVWVDGALHKVPTAAFDYALLDPADRQTGPWRVTSPPPDGTQGPAESSFDLTFEPQRHRREQRRLLIARTDFNQYYGLVSGQVRVAGRVFELEPTFAVTEDSLLEL
jgi:hypothetical protein